MTSSPLKTFVISGFEQCSPFQEAILIAKEAARVRPDLYKEPEVKTFSTRSEYRHWLDFDGPPRNSRAAEMHSSCPFIYVKETEEYVGKFSDMKDLIYLEMGKEE